MARLFIIILSIVLSFTNITSANEKDVINEIEPASTLNQLDEDIELEKDIDSIDYKQPVSKRKIAKKFLLAMGGVTISSLALFILLSLYNKMRENFLNQIKTLDGKTSLEVPDDFENSIKTFLDQTSWK